ncbi:MAG: 2Fe-2S iron-sulfur cluster binding domain-containing protein [Hyphomicrobiales bacterium]|nr:2Fe-2S iron-sulfur cluster binding domain-containing protein [Hyphomicrobiales bacterium]
MRAMPSSDELRQERSMRGAGSTSPEESRPDAGLRSGHVPVHLRVNGTDYRLALEPRTSLLDALREHLGLTGSKKGCNQGACGACTLLVDGERILSCLSLAVQHEGREIITIEGLTQQGELHALQQVFIEHDGFQCGYCTPGQICSAVAMLHEFEAGHPSAVTEDMADTALALSDAEIKERMSGNLCRCGAYVGICDAIREAHDGKTTP